MEALKPGKGCFLRIMVEGVSETEMKERLMRQGMKPKYVLARKRNRVLIILSVSPDIIDPVLENISSLIPPLAEVVETSFTYMAELETQVLEISDLLKINIIGDRNRSPVFNRNNSISISGDLAFGSGLHPTTRMCLDLLIKAHNMLPAMEYVLDLGTGTGILALSTVKLGACRVLAVDVDFRACQECRENIARNRYDHRVFAVHGSVDCVKGPFDLVMANIVSSVLYELVQDLVWVTRPGGLVILSGFFPRNKKEIFYKLGHGRAVALVERDGWQSLLWQRT